MTGLGQLARLVLAAGTTFATLGAQVPAALQPSVADRRAEYQARASKLAKDDVVGHFALAEWCARKRLPLARRWELRHVLRLVPDHVAARQALGHVRIAGRWLPAAEASKHRGRVLVDGVWMTKYEAARRHHGRKVSTVRDALQARANTLLVQLADGRGAVRAKALTDLLALAEEWRWPRLASLARAQARIYDAYWRDPPPARPPTVPRGRAPTPGAIGLLGIQLQHSRLLGMETVTTSLGSGAPVRLQLPRLQTISLGTTVPVPLGTGTVLRTRR